MVERDRRFVTTTPGICCRSCGGLSFPRVVLEIRLRGDRPRKYSSRMTTNPFKILLIEDDTDLRNLVATELQANQWAVEEAVDGVSGLQKALTGQFSIVILDLNLPQLDGLEVCKRIRGEGLEISILMLTARRDELDRVLGLELGADDYLSKPFSMRELIARVKAIVRRNERHQRVAVAAPPGDGQRLIFGPLELDIAMRVVKLAGAVIPISSMEFDLIQFLASAPGKAFTREELLEQVWGYSAVGYEQNVTTHINRIRRKLEPDPENPRFVKTVRGFGYAFARPEEF